MFPLGTSFLSVFQKNEINFDSSYLSYHNYLLLLSSVGLGNLIFCLSPRRFSSFSYIAASVSLLEIALLVFFLRKNVFDSVHISCKECVL